MIDIHSHILPGIDDGAKNIAESLSMAKVAVKQGIHTIIATPHHQNGLHINYKQDIENYVNKLKESLDEANIPLTVLTGQETRINGEMIIELQHGTIATLNSQYVIVELPSTEVPSYVEQLLFDIQIAGYKPIVVHPERNHQIRHNPSILYNLVQRGALTQITASSLVGKFGKTIKKLSHQLIDHNLTHFIASDAHNTTTRGFVMQDAYQILKTNHGSELYYMFMKNAQLLIDDQLIKRNEPEPITRKRRFLDF